MKGIIDVHCHILPGMDDGSSSVGMSIAMLRREAEQGIGQVIATPHFRGNRENPREFLERRSTSEKRLREAMESRIGLPELTMGAEVAFFSGMSESEWLPELAMERRNGILIEMPEAPWTGSMFRELAGIYEKHGIIPVIAHVERYLSPFRDYDIPGRLEALPVLVQANASFFLNPRTSRRAMNMLRRKQIHLLGSDCHTLAQRGPDLGKALEQIAARLGMEAVFWIQECQGFL